MDPPRGVSPQMGRRCRESQPVPRFSNSQANVWAGYMAELIASNEIDENFQFRRRPSAPPRRCCRSGSRRRCR